MKTIGNLELEELLETQNNIVNSKINLESILEIDISKLKKITFKNCSFTGSDIYFREYSSSNHDAVALHFIDCEFHNEQLNFSNCKIENIYFAKVIIKGDLSLSNCEVSSLTFRSGCKIDVLDIYNSKINNRFIINKRNVFQKISISNVFFKSQVTFFDSVFSNIDISYGVFENQFFFNKNFINNSISIDNCSFHISNFDTNTFYSSDEAYHLNLLNNKFKDVSSFSHIKASKSKMIIRDCDFNKFTRFNNSKFKLLHIEQSNFKDISSFQDTNLESVFIDRTNFDKTSYFDDIFISNIEDCNKRTLRNIKQQLQRANNKIDFDRFKSYEISAYREELKKEKKIWLNNKDAFILGISNLFSKNGTNWFRALLVTIIGSFIFYSLFFWINVNSAQFGNFDISKVESFINGFTKFLIPTKYL